MEQGSTSQNWHRRPRVRPAQSAASSPTTSMHSTSEQQSARTMTDDDYDPASIRHSLWSLTNDIMRHESIPRAQSPETSVSLRTDSSMDESFSAKARLCHDHKQAAKIYRVTRQGRLERRLRLHSDLQAIPQ